MEIPPYDQLMLPLFTALKVLGGSASISEIDEYVADHSGLPAELLDLPHNAEKSNQTEFQYRLAWARTYLKKAGLVENSSRGVWVISPDKRHVQTSDPAEIVRQVRELHKQKRAQRDLNEELVADPDDGPAETAMAAGDATVASRIRCRVSRQLQAFSSIGLSRCKLR